MSIFNFIELLFPSTKFNFLPTKIREIISDEFGGNISIPEFFSDNVQKTIEQKVIEELKTQPSNKVLEALSYLVWVKGAKRFTEQDTFNLTPIEGKRIASNNKGNQYYDCTVIIDDFINEIISIDKKYNLGLNRCVRLQFGARNPDFFQNMAYLEFGQSCFLVDVAAFFFHNQWAKSFQVRDIQEATNKGIEWLNTTIRHNWYVVFF